MDIDNTANQISVVHKELQKRAKAAINISLTVRNWIIGFYIFEYTQNGEDRAEYGKKVLDTLSRKLKEKGLKNINERELRKYRLFYETYPFFIEIFEYENSKQGKRGTLSPVLDKVRELLPKNTENTIRRAVSSKSEDSIRGTVHPELQTDENRILKIPALKLITHLSYSHFEELVKIKENLKRTLYELETISGTWSTRELKKQIASLYFERSGLSTNKEKLQELANIDVETNETISTIRNPMVFSFLDLPINETIEEAVLEKALIDNLQEFLLELGNGFCFEARQKRILIDDEYFSIDMVFYHRILKCHVLLELKAEAFNHENIGQLNAYLQYYKDKITQKGDNPPIGILLCTESKPQMVRYALADKNNMQIAEYKLQLPSEEEIQRYVENRINEIK